MRLATIQTSHSWRTAGNLSGKLSLSRMSGNYTYRIACQPKLGTCNASLLCTCVYCHTRDACASAECHSAQHHYTLPGAVNECPCTKIHPPSCKVRRAVQASVPSTYADAGLLLLQCMQLWGCACNAACSCGIVLAYCMP